VTLAPAPAPALDLRRAQRGVRRIRRQRAGGARGGRRTRRAARGAHPGRAAARGIVEPDADLVGLSVASLEERYGEPDWQGAQEIVYRFPRACSDPSQQPRADGRRWAGHRARFAWSLGSDCLEEALCRSSARSQPIDLGCAPRAKRCPAVRRLVGLDELRVIEGLGLPHHAEGGRWSYFRPRHCAYERIIIELRVEGGRVTAATWKHEWTGQHCERVE
jgi:hypothetical protein